MEESLKHSRDRKRLEILKTMPFEIEGYKNYLLNINDKEFNEIIETKQLKWKKT